ncbi:MAG: AAA family ATPase [Alphaproteobacteria bacterium]|nr:AAA family ATPase [Alphaproteobacteria bacterium]
MSLDFNDLGQAAGFDAIRKCIESAALPEVQRRRLQPYTLSEIGDLPCKTYLVKRLLETSAMSVVYGKPNCGKSFFVLNLCFQIAMGKPWLGRKTKKGAVVYIAAEGGQSIRDRIEAGKKSGQIQNDAPFYLIPASVDLYDPEADTSPLIEEIQRLPEPAAIIVIDTLARAIAGGDENSPAAMGGFIKNCDRIREELGAHLLVVHHTGKDSERGARGHSSLLGAVDTEIMVFKDKEAGLIIAEVMKQRDGATGERFHFRLEQVIIRHDEDNEPVTSCVLKPGIADATPQLRGQSGRALEILQTLIAEQGEDFHPKGGKTPVKAAGQDVFLTALQNAKIFKTDKPDSIRKAFVRIIDKLNLENIAMTCADYIWIPDKSDKPGQNENDKIPNSDRQDIPLWGVRLSGMSGSGKA